MPALCFLKIRQNKATTAQVKCTSRGRPTPKIALFLFCFFCLSTTSVVDIFVSISGRCKYWYNNIGHHKRCSWNILVGTQNCGELLITKPSSRAVQFPAGEATGMSYLLLTPLTVTALKNGQISCVYQNFARITEFTVIIRPNHVMHVPAYLLASQFLEVEYLHHLLIPCFCQSLLLGLSSMLLKPPLAIICTQLIIDRDCWILSVATLVSKAPSVCFLIPLLHSTKLMPCLDRTKSQPITCEWAWIKAQNPSPSHVDGPGLRPFQMRPKWSGPLSCFCLLCWAVH